jgi:hypothetical protein
MDLVKRIRQLALLLLLVLGAVLLLVGCLNDEDEGERALVFANEYRAEDSWLVYPKRRKTPDFSYGDIRCVRQIYASN